MDYIGTIVEESLSNLDILKEIEITDQSIEKVSERDNTPWLDKWTIDTVKIKEDESEELANKLSKIIDTKHCNDWYCDFKNDKYHYVVFKDKVFKLKKGKKTDYETMQEYASKVGLIKEQMPTYDDLPINLLIGFLIYAKKNTYASGDAAKISSSRLGSNDYQYEEIVEGEKMIYHDTYFGGTKFIGEEVVYRGNDIPKWAMNYYGVTFDDSLSEEVMDKVLRPALSLVGEDSTVLPLRGPSKYQNGEYLYTFTSTGSMEQFTGIEKIYKNDKLIFKLECHGGLIE